MKTKHSLLPVSIINSHHVQFVEHDPSNHPNLNLRRQALKMTMACLEVKAENQY